MTNNRKTLTKKNIEAMAYAIMEQLIKHHADEDVKIYFNDCSIRTDKGGEGTRIATKIKIDALFHPDSLHCADARYAPAQ